MATIPSCSGQLPINGLSLYYEVYGELGRSSAYPLLLVPGAFTVVVGDLPQAGLVFVGGVRRTGADGECLSR
jgi:hypothetical protein